MYSSPAGQTETLVETGMEKESGHILIRSLRQLSSRISTPRMKLFGLKVGYFWLESGEDVKFVTGNLQDSSLKSGEDVTFGIGIPTCTNPIGHMSVGLQADTLCSLRHPHMPQT